MYRFCGRRSLVSPTSVDSAVTIFYARLAAVASLTVARSRLEYNLPSPKVGTAADF